MIVGVRSHKSKCTYIKVTRSYQAIGSEVTVYVYFANSVMSLINFSILSVVLRRQRVEQFLPDKARADNRGLSFSTCQLGPLVIPLVREFSLHTLYDINIALYEYLFFRFNQICHDEVSADAVLDNFGSISQRSPTKLGQAAFLDSHDSIHAIANEPDYSFVCARVGEGKASIIATNSATCALCDRQRGCSWLHGPWQRLIA